MQTQKWAWILFEPCPTFFILWINIAFCTLCNQRIRNNQSQSRSSECISCCDVTNLRVYKAEIFRHLPSVTSPPTLTTLLRARVTGLWHLSKVIELWGKDGNLLKRTSLEQIVSINPTLLYSTKNCDFSHIPIFRRVRFWSHHLGWEFYLLRNF